MVIENMKIYKIFIFCALLAVFSGVSFADDSSASQDTNSSTQGSYFRNYSGDTNNALLLGKIGNSTQNKNGSVEKDETSSESTQAEELQKQEDEFNKRLNVLTTVVDDLEKRFALLRKQTDVPSQYDIDRLDEDLSASEKELESISQLTSSDMSRAQCADIRDRLFNLRMTEDILKRRWGVVVSVFGLDFFKNTNQTQPLSQRNAPADYKIRVGDKLRFLVVSKLGAQNEYSFRVDKSGGVVIGGIGRLSVAGRTVKQVESLASSKISSRFKQLHVKVTVEEISSIQIQVAGEVLRPGTYTLPGMSSVFDALSAAGGPTKSGTFRHISLVRDGQSKRRIDLYDFLINGSKNQDKILQDRDLIFVAPVGPTLVVGGEVNRPGQYEPTFPITLAQALKMAGGAKSTGYLQHVQVERIENNQYNVLLSEPIKGESKGGFVLKPGDTVTVTSVLKDKTNQVSIEGPVNAPGLYGYKNGMHVAELLKLAQGLESDKEVYRDRADILRIDSVKGTQIVSFNLGKALEGDPANNVMLDKLDRVFIYEPDQVVFRPKLVTISGAAARPGTYKRTGGMRVSDAVAAAGGVLPETYLTRADIVRQKSNGETEFINVNLQSALNGDPDSDIALQDRDQLNLYTQSDVQWQNHKVRIEGAVQREGEYVRSDNMHVSDLIFIAGGLLPEAAKKAELARCADSGASNVINVDLTNLVTGSGSDVALKDGDVVTIASVNPHLRQPEIVYITGEVLHPGPYALNNQNEKLDDIIKRAGGLTSQSNCSGMLFLRKKDSFENPQQEKDTDVILQKTKMFADKQLMVQLAKMGVTTAPDKIAEISKTVNSETEKPAEVVADKNLDQKQEDSGETIQNTSNVTMKKNDEKLVSAMGLPVGDSNKQLAAQVFGQDEKTASLMQSARISVNFSRALADIDSPDNLTLRDGDRIFIPKKSNVVTVVGAVLHPHSFAAGPGQNADYYIQRSGGFSGDAEFNHVIVVRANGDALPKSDVKSVEPGDMIVVPTTGLVDVAKKWEKVGDVTKAISDVLSAAYILTRL